MTTFDVMLSKKSALAVSALKIGGLTVLLCFSSFIKLPLFFTPVPVTLQTLVVFVAGGLLGPAEAFVSVAAYIAIGIFGAPFFANAGWGIPYLLGPTGGYLLGFLAAAWMISKVRNSLSLRTVAANFICMTLGMVVIHACGALWLMAGLRMVTLQAFFLGSLPFVLPDLMKAWIAAWICVRLYKR